ncbi:MAG: flagellar basal body rod protein FlgC [Acidobacteria bacterium RIFCSPLOWO2_12_FULL_67_14b]|nr:MAG: flagellar basal body rod protein FlgC [Acidobacteria bacterium RIFCSPLOWO2_12_FULL_67_14b]
MSTLGNAITAAASALNAQRARLEVAVSNIANAESTRGPDGQPYRRRDVVLAATPVDPFDAALGQAAAMGVQVVQVVEDTEPFRMRYEPSHPDADANGYLAVPNVDVPEEMVDMLGAARAYQANLTAINVIRDTIQRSLELGR